MNYIKPLDIEATLKFLYLNATSLENKFDEFVVVVDTNRPNIIGASETWFRRGGGGGGFVIGTATWIP